MNEAEPGGFRLAAVFDAVDPVTGPGFAPDRVRLPEGPARQAVLRYLRDGAAVLLTPTLMDDVVDPARRGVVPLGFRTDGQWIWTDTVTYYLETHGLAPEPGLLAHVRAQGDGPCPQPGREVLERATAFVLAPPQPEQRTVWTVGS
ncbi:hypothetical protein PUR71_37125 [Streptomyces sp. SP17BM10]|uniref:hypothetical protein n=1 Tax=Streptomyces sp. SP17BM10 TaxID=3002530 RepID=UPI002E79B682|nr:hypothetical protein [Streptomyces sp. SP17BM10]MEE1788483.1 hypothetical protein [Streptomyces sp. SP17BM10]